MFLLHEFQRIKLTWITSTLQNIAIKVVGGGRYCDRVTPFYANSWGMSGGGFYASVVIISYTIYKNCKLSCFIWKKNSNQIKRIIKRIFSGNASILKTSDLKMRRRTNNEGVHSVHNNYSDVTWERTDDGISENSMLQTGL